MDIGTISGVGTLIVTISFIILTCFLYIKQDKNIFNEAKMLPFEKDETKSNLK